MKCRLTILVLITLPLSGSSQKTVTSIDQPGSFIQKANDTGKLINNQGFYDYDTAARLNVNSYFTLLFGDLKQEFTKPFHMTKKDWGNVGKFAVIEGALAFADEPVQQNAAPIKTDNPAIGKVSKFVTNFGGPYEGFALAAMGAYGLVFKNEKMKTTTLLATQAYITGTVLTSVLKYAGGRTRPSLYNPNQEAEPQFLGPFPKKINGVSSRDSYTSFPSGHTTVAFAAATVFASEYSHKLWVPIIAYSSATLVGLSRITENKHWATDVLAGAAIGFLAGKNAVTNYHRYARSRNAELRNPTRSPSVFNTTWGILSQVLLISFNLATLKRSSKDSSASTFLNSNPRCRKQPILLL